MERRRRRRKRGEKEEKEAEEEHMESAMHEAVSVREGQAVPCPTFHVVTVRAKRGGGGG